MRKREKYQFIVDYFSKNMPNAETELHYNNEYELVVAVSLSAQCTDKRVNIVTPNLFHKFPDFKALSLASSEEVFTLIKSISYPNNKAKNLVAMAQKVQSDFGGHLPKEREELMSLPGVGRKTANVLCSVLFNEPTMAVDTHVFRVSHRLGLVASTCKTPLSVEKELIKNFSSDVIPLAHHWLILHGRYTCKALKPDCQNCGISIICNYLKKKAKS